MTRQIHVGGIPIGGGAPVTIQSMTNTRTDDLESTLSQIRSLAAAGCQIVRVAVPDRAAARAVADNPGHSYTPLFIYGESGLGKTHLLYAIANSIHQNKPGLSVVYVKGDTFTNELIQAIREGRNQEFRDKYRSADIFLMDDVQFVAGRASTQEEMFHTFNTLYEAKRQIVFTSDRPPKEMLRLDDRLKTRFEWGLLADIQPPDYETRMAIIKNKAIRMGVELPEAVLQYVAENITADVPDAMVEAQSRQFLDNFKMQLAQQGLQYDQYMKATGMDEAQLLADAKEPALKQVRMDLAMAAIIKEENIDATDEEVEAEFQRMADQYGMDLETVKKYLQAEQVKDQLKSQKAIAVVVDSATAVKAEKKPAKKTAKKAEDAEGEEAAEEKPAKKTTRKKADEDGEEKKPAKKATKKAAAKKEEETPAESK